MSNNHLHITYEMLNVHLVRLAKKIEDWFYSKGQKFKEDLVNLKIYPVPRGGVPVALGLQAALRLHPNVSVSLVEALSDCDIVVDDIVDSGNTKQEILKELSSLGKEEVPFFAMLDYTLLTPDERLIKPWVVFPWESVNREQDDTIVGTLRNRAAKSPATGFLLMSYALTTDEAKELRVEQKLRYKHLMKSLRTEDL